MSRKNSGHISVSKDHYDRISAEAKRKGVSMSFLVEQKAAEVLGLEPPKPRKGWSIN